MKKIYIAILLAVSSYSLSAQILAWDFNTNSGTESSVNPIIADSDLASTQLIRGNVNPAALANSFNSDGWTTTNVLNDAITNDSYYEFTVNANNGFNVSLAGINANFRRTGSGPRSYQWMYSLNGITFTNIGSVITFTSTATNGIAQAPVDLTGIPELQNVSSSITITLRLYAYNSSNEMGQFALGRLSGNDLSISGTVSPNVIPVRLISFSAVNNRNTTRLHWSVNCTSSSVTFELLRGKSTSSFSPVYTKSETQSRCSAPFDFVDELTPEGNNYYRLKIIDIDGKITYSNILQVQNRKTAHAGISLFPTLVSDNASITIPAATSGNAQLLFIDAIGRTIKTMNTALIKGTNNVSISTTGFVTGMYHIKILMEDGTTGNAVMIKQ